MQLLFLSHIIQFLDSFKFKLLTSIKFRFSAATVKYSSEPDNPTKSCKSRGAYLRVRFKITRETSHAIRKLPWLRPNGAWRMSWNTSKIFHLLAFVEELGELFRPKIDILMDRGVGLKNLKSLFLIYLKMLRVMLKWRAWTWILYTYLIFKLTKNRSRDVEHDIWCSRKN